jgi:hypothetical protein
MLPVRKLLADGKLRVEGQKRATQYYLAEAGAAAAGGKSPGVKARRKKAQRKRTA